MSKRTKELERLWWDWLGTSERLLSTLHEQTGALTLRQVERVEKLQPELDGLMAKMEEIDAKAVDCAKTLADSLGCEPNLRSLVASLEKTEGMEVQAIANRVIVAGRNVQNVIDKNKALIENELAYVNGSMTVIAREAQKADGPYAPVTSGANVLMNQAA
ncbi:flagellar export chaperone FlgN [Kamptonema cortianum]|nr:flagellar export chaperone FlgN [Geitlerinema splendidum]MDK3161088.1 flagellar export chaperone FlgN [Kamptonema cortianum]